MTTRKGVLNMILRDAVVNMIMKLDLFMNKKGQDLNIRRDLIRAINDVTGEDSLDAVYVNNVENFNIPDVVVLPLYNKDFNIFLMDGDMSNTCPFGYTLEIHERCFTKYTAEELAAVIIHDILQNVQSCTAKIRFVKAYNTTMSQFKTDDVLDLFDEISNSEIMFMAFMDICTRPFRVPANGYDYIGTDEVLCSMKLADAYDSYLEKSLPMSNDTPESRIELETRNDHRTMDTIIKACMDKDIRHYYAMIRNGVPLVSLDHIFGGKNTIASLGLISHKRDFKRRYEPKNGDTTMSAITESFINPKNETEIRFQVDKIITEMRYAESEAEREVILFKIKTLTIKLGKLLAKVDKEYQKTQSDSLRNQHEVIQNFMDELEMLRDKTVKMDIKQVKYGLFIKYPVGYEG